jgi:methionine-rich copper-binding protein CopC
MENKLLPFIVLLAACGGSNKAATNPDLAMAPDVDMATLMNPMDLGQSPTPSPSSTPANDGGVDGMVAGAAPFLVSSTPGNFAAAAPINSTLTLLFSKAMDEKSVVATFTPSVSLGAGTWSNGDTVVTFTPTAPLTNSTNYQIAIAGRSSDGAMLPPTAIRIATAPPPDTTPPTITATTPTNGATGFDPTTAVSIKFSEAMDLSSVAITVTPRGQLAPTPAVAWSEGYTRVTLANPPQLASGASITVTVAGTDLAGNALTGTTSFGFTTKDVTPPRVIGVGPPPLNNAASNLVGTSTKPSITFSEPMDHASVQSAFTVVNEGTDGSGNTSVSCTFSWSNNDTTVTCDPGALANGTYYLMTITNGGKDKAGNPISFVCVDHPTASPAFLCPTRCAAHPECAAATCSTYPLCVPTSQSWTMKTVAPATPADTTPPTVTASDPGGIGIAVDPPAPIKIYFSESMRPDTVAAAFSTTPASTGTFYWTDNTYTVVEYLPDGPWPYAINSAHNISFTVSTAAKDVAGNAMASAYTNSFRTMVLGQATMTFELNGNTGYVYDSVPPNGSTQVNTGDAIGVGSWSFTFSPACNPTTTTIKSDRGFATMEFPCTSNCGANAPLVISKIVSATLMLYVNEADGNLQALGNLNVESVWSANDGKLTNDSFSEAALADDPSILPLYNDSSPLLVADVSPQVRGGFSRASSQDNRMQLRLRWDIDTLGWNCDYLDNGYKIDASKSKVVFTYETPNP